MRKEGEFINDKYALINDVIDDSSFLNEQLGKDIILSKLTKKEGEYIEQQISTAFMAQEVIIELIRKAKAKDIIRQQHKLKPLFNKEMENELRETAKRVKEMFLMKTEVIKAMSRNREDNFIMNALFGIKNKEESKEEQEEEEENKPELIKVKKEKKKKKESEESEE